MPETLTDSYIEKSAFTLFKIDLLNLIKTKVILAKEFHILPSEIDQMRFWEYELFLEELNNMVKEENNKQEAEMKKYHIQDAMNMTKPGAMNKMMGNSMPKQPSVPSINVGSPKIGF